jgi:hypothetical protein
MRLNLYCYEKNFSLVEEKSLSQLSLFGRSVSGLVLSPGKSVLSFAVVSSNAFFILVRTLSCRRCGRLLGATLFFLTLVFFALVFLALVCLPLVFLDFVFFGLAFFFAVVFFAIGSPP